MHNVTNIVKIRHYSNEILVVVNETYPIHSFTVSGNKVGVYIVQLLKMDNSRLTKIIFDWEYNLKLQNWSNDVLQ